MDVEWGDMTEFESFFYSGNGISSGSNKSWSHVYATRPPYAITISGEQLISLVCPNMNVISLDVNDNTQLIELYCSGNQITEINLSDLKKMKTIDCKANHLSAEAINALFESLHDDYQIEMKSINIADNPGTQSCDISVAENKGWIVYR